MGKIENRQRIPKPGILSAKPEKPISKVTKTAKPQNPMSSSAKDPGKGLKEDIPVCLWRHPGA